jgi:hypothetical protein
MRGVQMTDSPTASTAGGEVELGLPARRRVDRRRRQPHLGFGRSVSSETEAPSKFVNPV